MNTADHERKHIALWSISTHDMLKLIGNHRENRSGLTIFDNTHIADIGSGLSDFLSYISENSSPGKLYAVDPIYTSEESFHQAITTTAKWVQMLTKIFSEWVEWVMTDSLAKLAERKSIIDTARYRVWAPNISYTSHINSIPKQSLDYIFVTFVLEHIDNWGLFLDNLKGYSKSWGKIIITDFTIKPYMREFRRRIWLWENWYRLLWIDTGNRISIEITVL